MLLQLLRRPLLRRLPLRRPVRAPALAPRPLSLSSVASSALPPPEYRAMDIDQRDFADALPRMLDAIRTATFIAVDAEFTGLYDSGSNAAAPLDDFQERYTKLKSSSEDFMVLQVRPPRGRPAGRHARARPIMHAVVQFGFCTFRWLAQRSVYEVCPFNVYLFPRQMIRAMPDRCFRVRPPRATPSPRRRRRPG